jgi:hypothetical protein
MMKLVPAYLSKGLWFLFLLFGMGRLLISPVFADEVNNQLYLPMVSKPDGKFAQQSTKVYYLSPDGDDTLSGHSESQAWKTFDRAWQDLYPGDTLILLDGVYYQSLNPNKRNGEAGKPITIRAKNDGKVIIDGEYKRIPVKLGDTWPGPIGNFFVIEGISARNSSSFVVLITGAHHNILRRVSAYNANTDTNSAVIGVVWESAQHNIIEDCVAAGSGRKMLYTYKGENNIFRRCYADWQEWDGREWHDCWPWGDGIEIYNGSFNTIENSISYGQNPTWAINVMANDPSAKAIGNKVLGSMAILAGMQNETTPMDWGDERPQPTNHTCVRNFNWPSQRVGFMVNGSGEIRDNVLQDIYSWGNAGLGLSFNPGTEFHVNTRNNIIKRATIFNNGLDNPEGAWPGQFGGVDTDVIQRELDKFIVEDSRIEKIFIDWPNYPDGARNMTSLNGEGARLTNRYVDGVLTDQPLWPWPMEDRIQAELGFSVTDFMTKLIFGTSTSINDHETIPNTSLDLSGIETTFEGIENEYIRKNIR